MTSRVHISCLDTLQLGSSGGVETISTRCGNGLPIRQASFRELLAVYCLQRSYELYGLSIQMCRMQISECNAQPGIPNPGVEKCPDQTSAPPQATSRAGDCRAWHGTLGGVGYNRWGWLCYFSIPGFGIPRFVLLRISQMSMWKTQGPSP
jgi:hypothetical protein